MRTRRTRLESIAAALCLAAGAAACASPAGAPAVTPAVGGSGASPLPFIENDYPRALARAREASLPLFVEVWAPW